MGAPGRFPTHLLVDLPNWLGDVVMALPAVARLVSANAGGTTVLHTASTSLRLLAFLFPTATVASSSRRASPWNASAVLRSRWGRFDVGLTFRHATRAKLLVGTAAWQRIGSRSDGGAALLTDPVCVDRGSHQIFDFDPMLERLGVPKVDATWRPAPLPQLTAEGWAALPEALRAVGRSVRVGIAPTAAWGPSKRWPAQRFGELAAEMIRKGLQPIVLVGPGEETVARRVADGAGTALPVVGPTLDTATLFGLLGHLKTVVSNDSGPMHLAALAGCRVVAVFGPTDPKRTSPIGLGHRIVWPQVDCSPCLKRHCPLGHHHCLQRLSAEQVMTQVTLALDRSSAQAVDSETAVAY